MKQLLALLLFVPSLCLAQLPEFVSETGLIGWYPLDGDIVNAANPDEPGILTGGNFVLGQDGFAEGALEITNGSSAEIHPEIGTTESLTVSMWLNEGTNSGNSTALYTALYLGQQGFDGDTTKSLDITRDRINHPGNGRLQANLNYDFGTAGFDELDGGWVHLVSVFDSGLLSIYRNGFLMESTESSVSSISITGASFLGAGHVGNSTEPFNFCHCALDDVGIWNRVLTEVEIGELYLSSSMTIGCTDSLACNFDSTATEDDGSCTISPVLTLPTDTSTFESTLLLDAGPDLGTYLWSTGETGETITVTESGQYSVQVMQNGSVNRSVHFDATSTEQADFSAVTSAFVNEGTIAIDFKIDSPDSATPDLGGTWSMPSYPLFFMDNGAHDPLAIRIGRGCYAAEASITLEDDDCGQSNPHVRASWGTDPLHFFDGQWHRIVLSSGAEGHALYVDGTLLSLDYSLGDPSINVWPGDANAFLIGRELNADWDFVGDLDNLMVWSSPLAFNQASSLDPCQFNPTSPDLLGFWPFNGSDASVALDASGNNQHGMLDASRTMQPAQTACSPCFAESTVMVQLLISNCTDSLACNYNAMAILDDGSCDYSCCPGPGCCADGTVWDIELEQCVGQSSPCDTVFLPIPSCGPGTVWDPVAEECIIAIPADLNYDGCVTVADLLQLLAVHGTCPPYPEWPDEPTDTTWACGDPITYWDYDYATVLIGDQCWFADNLKTNKFSDGDSIPSGLTDGEWITTTTGATAVFGEGSSSCAAAWPGFCDETQSLSAHGRLYNWYAVDDARGLCPSGWHVPTDGEWMVLEMELGMSESEANSTGWRGTDEGTELKSTSGWDNDGNGTDDFGFSALPGGGRFSSGGGFYSAGDFGNWWSSSSIGIDAWHRSMRGINPGISRNGYSARRGFSVRCLRDSE